MHIGTYNSTHLSFNSQSTNHYHQLHPYKHRPLLMSTM